MSTLTTDSKNNVDVFAMCIDCMEGIVIRDGDPGKFWGQGVPISSGMCLLMHTKCETCMDGRPTTSLSAAENSVVDDKYSIERKGQIYHMHLSSRMVRFLPGIKIAESLGYVAHRSSPDFVHMCEVRSLMCTGSKCDSIVPAISGCDVLGVARVEPALATFYKGLA